MNRQTIRIAARTLLLACVVPTSLMPVAQADDGEVNIYSARKEELILPLLERFQAQSGIEVNLITGDADGLLKRLQIEGSASPADVFITVDAGRLQRAKDADVLQPARSDAIDAAVPAHLRDTEDFWVGLSRRARTIIYAKDRVDPANLSTYEALADPSWKGRLCIRSSNNIYNQSLVASMIEAIGPDATEAWARGLVANFAKPPAGGDTDQLLAVAAGVCDLTIVNTYYFGRLVNSDDAAEREAAAKLAVFWPNQDDRGAHVNVSGAGIAKHADHPDAAIRLLEFLVTPESQSWYAEVNHEYPVVQGVPFSETLKQFGEFRADDIELTRLGMNNRDAVMLMDRAGWR